MHIHSRIGLRKKRGMKFHRFAITYKVFLIFLLIFPIVWLSFNSNFLPPSPPYPSEVTQSQLTPSRQKVRLIPQRTRHAFQPDRAHSPPREASIHAILLCPKFNPCCLDHIPNSVSALLTQTLIPTRLTLLHKCDSHADLRKVLRNTLEAGLQKASSYTLYPVATHQRCNSTLSSCALHHLSLSAEADTSAYILLLNAGHILEPVALEKLYLSLNVRPHIPAIRMLAFEEGSLPVDGDKGNRLGIRHVPLRREMDSLPVLLNSSAYQEAISRSVLQEKPWAPLIDVMARARVLREALYARTESGPPFNLNGDLPAHLLSEEGAQRWSARRDEEEMYADDLVRTALDVSPVAFGSVKKREVGIFLVLPWMQMGGSEKCMLDIAERVLDMGWSLTFVLTMPFWRETELGEIGLENQWLDKALALSADTFDLLALGSQEKSVRLLRHLLASRRPDFVLMANSRWAYGMSRLIKTLLPSTIVADYNHMIHMNWEGGGMPRYGANNSEYFDLHLTASKDVADSMKGWIDPAILKKSPNKVQPCYIGTNPEMLYKGVEKTSARKRMRNELSISDSQIVVLFAGRFVVDKGLDVMAELVTRVAEESTLAKRLVFLFVGSGDQEHLLRNLHYAPIQSNLSRVLIKPPAQGLRELREYYALSDILILPSVNEGIALVVYEAMAAGVLVATTDVGGQKEVVTPATGVLLPNFRSISRMTSRTLETLKEFVEHPEEFSGLIRAGQEVVRKNFTTEQFRSCVIDNLLRVENERKGKVYKEDQNDMVISEDLEDHLVVTTQVERYHGQWNREAAPRTAENSVTIGIKTYVCDTSRITELEGLLRSIRAHHPRIQVLLGNDGPMKLEEEPFLKNDPYAEEVLLPSDCGISYGRNRLVNVTTTKYFVLMDDDHVFDDTTNLTTLFEGIRQDQFDLVGMRVRHLPGIDELERSGVLIPRYVALVTKLEDRELTLCVWNENKGPSIFGITHPIPVHVLHNAFIGLTEVLRIHPWRNELKVNEHMTFFLDAKDAGLKVGYLPSVFVHHRSRDFSDCYYKMRFREEKYAHLLPYEEQFIWDMKCQREFPERVRSHILKYELDLPGENV